MRKYFFYTLLLLFITVHLLSCKDESGILSAKETISLPEGIRFGTFHNTLRGVTLTWSSNSACDSVKWGYTEDYEQGKFAGKPRIKDNRKLYDYTFPNLKSSSQIHFTIKYKGKWSEEALFNTSADTSSENFSFIAGGDSHAGDSENTNQRWEKISNLISGENVDFIIHLGDVVDDNNDWSQWQTYFEYGKNLTTQKIIFYTQGNHEYGSISLFNQTLPGNKKWYSFKQGNALFICLLSEEDFDVQYNWLLEQLRNSDKEWIIVFFHRPFFTRGSHKSEMTAYRSTWWKAFDDYGVDIIMSGHTHSYIRTKPINLNLSDSSSVSEYGSKKNQGRLEFVAGGLGGDNSKECEKWFTAKAYSGMHYIKFQINGHTLHFDAYNETGTLIDSMTVYEGGAPFTH